MNFVVLLIAFRQDSFLVSTHTVALEDEIDLLWDKANVSTL